jgi:hypothetical protein
MTCLRQRLSGLLPDDEGFFSTEVPHGNQGHFDITVRAVDRHLNENIFRETVIGGNISAIERVAIETGGSVETGRILPLKLFAYDAAGNRMEIPAGYVTWSIARGEDTARIENGGLRAVKKGQCVVAAGYSVSGGYTWTDMAVVDILGADTDSEEADIAYLTNITASSGTLSPAFNPYITTYSITTPYNLASIWLRPETGLENAVIRVDGQIVENGTSSGQLVLNVGKNTFEIVVELRNCKQRLTPSTYTAKSIRRNRPRKTAIPKTAILKKAIPKMTMPETAISKTAMIPGKTPALPAPGPRDLLSCMRTAKFMPPRLWTRLQKRRLSS